MERSKLKYFQMVAQTGHMTEAAKVLHISQPALSKAISQLEEELGVLLFNREGRNIQLNKFGKILLEYVNRGFTEFEAGERVIKELAGLEEGYISVAATFPHIFPILIGEYLKVFPKVQIKQMQSSSSQMADLIQRNQIDFGISSYPITAIDVEWQALVEDEIYLTVSENHPFAKKASIDLEEVQTEKFIGMVKGYGFRDMTDKLCLEAEIEPVHQIEVEESRTILELVKMGYGISFTPGLSLLTEHPGVAVIPINYPNFSRPIGVSYKKNSYFSKASKEFFSFIIDFFDDYSKGNIPIYKD